MKLKRDVCPVCKIAYNYLGTHPNKCQTCQEIDAILRWEAEGGPVVPPTTYVESKKKKKKKKKK